MLDKVEAIVGKDPAVEYMIAITGFSIFYSYANQAFIFATLKDWKERGPEDHVFNVLRRTNIALAGISEARVFALNEPPISGMGNVAGFDYRLNSLDGDREKLDRAAQELVAAAQQDPRLAGVRNVAAPQVQTLFLDVDRNKAKALGVPLQDLYATVGGLLGSSFINQFTRFGTNLKVKLQSEAAHRADPAALERFYVRNAKGDLVPLGTLAKTEWKSAPIALTRYNGYPSIQLNGIAAPGRSSGDALAAMEELSAAKLPEGTGYQWSGQSLQEKISGAQATLIFALSLIFVFLFLAALYESWSLPIAVFLVVPIGILGALIALFIRGTPNDVFFQVSLITLVGLAGKNGILIVEFAKQQYEAGKSVFDAAVEAARLRLRPIVMTSLAFVTGVIPLVIASGAGAATQHSVGTGIMGGMIAATLVGVFFTPLFFYLATKFLARKRSRTGRGAGGAGPGARRLTDACATCRGDRGRAGCRLHRRRARSRRRRGRSSTCPPRGRTFDHRAIARRRGRGARSSARRTIDALIREALVNNTDLRVAADRVELARAQFGITRSVLFPQLDASAAYTRQRQPGLDPSDNVVSESASLVLAVPTWEIDLWGRVRSATEAARRDLLASEEDRKALYTSIVAQVATGYVRLLELDAQLEIARQTVATRRESLRLIDARLRGGVASRLELNDAITLVAGRRADDRVARAPAFADRKRARDPGGSQSRPDRPRPTARRIPVAAGAAGGPAVGAADPALRHPRGRADAARERCECRRRSPRVLPGGEPDRARSALPAPRCATCSTAGAMRGRSRPRSRCRSSTQGGYRATSRRRRRSSASPSSATGSRSATRSARCPMRWSTTSACGEERAALATSVERESRASPAVGASLSRGRGGLLRGARFVAAAVRSRAHAGQQHRRPVPRGDRAVSRARRWLRSRRRPSAARLSRDPCRARGVRASVP